MARKRWTQQTAPNHTTQLLRQRKKWQIALRRYLLEGQKSLQYAPYFGLNAALFRNWIENQFEAPMNWDNFSSVWQLDHIIPVAYFNVDNDEELRLCWNFINIRPSFTTAPEKTSFPIDPLTAKAYFTYLHQATDLPQCAAMVEKINAIELSQRETCASRIQFLTGHKEQIIGMQAFDVSDFERLNTGTPYTDLAFEKSFFKKFA